MLIAIPNILLNKITRGENEWILKDPDNATAEEKEALDKFIATKKRLQEEMIAPLPLE